MTGELDDGTVAAMSEGPAGATMNPLTPQAPPPEPAPAVHFFVAVYPNPDDPTGPGLCDCACGATGMNRVQWAEHHPDLTVDDVLPLDHDPEAPIAPPRPFDDIDEGDAKHDPTAIVDYEMGTLTPPE